MIARLLRRHQQTAETYVQPSKLSLNQYLDGYLVGPTRDRRESAKSNYRHAFKPVRERLAERPAQRRSLTTSRRNRW